jgi:hypothetical protein
MKYLMFDGDHRSLDELYDDDLVDELKIEFVHGRDGEKALAIFEELKKRLDKPLDTKALEIAAKVLVGIPDCPNELARDCPIAEDSDIDAACVVCWIAYLRQKAGEAA